MDEDARQDEIERVVDEVRTLLVDRFGAERIPTTIPPDEPLFAVGAGLSSIEGIEFLVVVEQYFDIKIKDLDRWLNDEPTLENVARYILDQRAPSP